jgi:hypothetical protein
MAKSGISTHTNDQIRELILKFFHKKSSEATSLRGKKGSSLKMSDVKSGLKKAFAFKDNQIISNLTYLLSQGWIKEEVEKKSFTTKGGVSVPSETRYYSITAAGTDKLEGPGNFTPKKFEGIHIEATGQNIITIGDGNQINIKFKELAEALMNLKENVKNSDIPEESKIEIVADVETIQGQLAKPSPNKSVIRTIWNGIEKIAAAGGIIDLIQKVTPFVLPLIS